MLLEMALIVALVSTFVEVKLVHAWPFLNKMYLIPKVGVWINIFGSFLLSFLIGVMFSAQGVTVFMGGIISTGLSQWYFSVEGYCQRQGWSWVGFKNSLKSTQHKISATKQSTVEFYNDFKQPAKDVANMVKFTAKVISWPVRSTRKMSAAYTRRRMAA